MQGWGLIFLLSEDRQFPCVHLPSSSWPGGMWAERSALMSSVLEAQMSYQDAAGSQSLALCHDGNVQGFGQVARIKQLKPQMRNSNFQSF